ncbi:MAG TPA: PP2C family serine/threonine-protein phosphatase [Polyangia bacterium]
MKARAWATTDVGLKRDHNEDSYLCNEAIGLFAVADGMGGHLGGERASHLAVEILEKEIEPQAATLTGSRGAPEAGAESKSGLGPVAIALREATRKAGSAIHAEAERNPQLSGMGTTLTSAFFHGDEVTICHVGDSRVYLFRDGVARLLTEDHSWIQEQIKAGLVLPEDAIVARFRNIITRSVGFEPTVEPDLITLPVELGDCYVLCSDGLSNHLDEKEIAEVLTGAFYAEAGPVLVEKANQKGGDDNITCVVVYIANE